MPVELRKRKEPASEAATAPPAKKKGPVAKAMDKVKEVVSGSPKDAKANEAVAVGSMITLEGFGGEIETHDGVKTTLKQLVEQSKGGVVLFTYPKASTPGCTTQACLFRDSYEPLTSTGFSIYGLSKDTPKSNTAFKAKQNLPYPLLCDPDASLISAIGMKKAPTGTTRGVFVVNKAGKVLAAEPGGPAATVEVVKKLVGGSADVPAVAGDSAEKPMVDVAAPTNGVNGATKDDVKQADTAAEVADTAEKLDSNEVPPVGL